MRVYTADDLRQQALNTVAVETLRGWRIAKEKAAKKSDAIVALAIACVAAIEGQPKAFDRAAREAIVQLNEVLARSNPWLIDDDDESLCLWPVPADAPPMAARVALDDGLIAGQSIRGISGR